MDDELQRDKRGFYAQITSSIILQHIFSQWRDEILKFTTHHTYGSRIQTDIYRDRDGIMGPKTTRMRVLRSRVRVATFGP